MFNARLAASTFFIIAILPAQLHSYNELSNITNTIHKNLNGPSFEDQSVDDFSSSPPDGGGPASGLTGLSGMSGAGVGTCGSCKMREAVRTRSLEAIKEQILLRLGMQTALNTTGRKLPEVPQDFFAKYPNLQQHGMLSDQPQQPIFKPGYNIMEEEDIMHIKTENIMVFSKPCEFILIN